jgi:hypothetical protein
MQEICCDCLGSLACRGIKVIVSPLRNLYHRQTYPKAVPGRRKRRAYVAAEQLDE